MSPYTLQAKLIAAAVLALVVFAAGMGMGLKLRAGQVNALKLQYAQESAHVADLARQAGEKFRQSEYAQAEAFNAIAYQYEQEKSHAVDAAKADVLACVRAGRCRVRLPSGPVSCAPQAPTGAGEPDAATDDGADLAAAAVGAGAACDAQVIGLQSILIEERKQ